MFSKKAAFDLRHVQNGRPEEAVSLEVVGQAPAIHAARMPPKEVLSDYIKEQKKLAKKATEDLRAKRPEDNEESPHASKVNQVFDGVTLSLAIVAIIAAIGLTLYSARPSWIARGGFELPFSSHEIAISVTFFWIELFAIVLGFRQIDQIATRQRERREALSRYKIQLRYLKQVADSLFDSIVALDNAWFDFVEKLSSAQTENGTFDTDKIDLAALNFSARSERDKFRLIEFEDDEMPRNVARMVARIVYVLDRMVDKTYDETGRLEEVNSEASPDVRAIEKSIGNLLDCANVKSQGVIRLLDAIEEQRKSVEVG